MRKLFGGLLVAVLLVPSAYGKNLNNLDDPNIGQADFRAFSEDLTGALSFKQVGPPEPLGLLGFEVGVDVSGTDAGARDVWNTALGEDFGGFVPMARIRGRVGLPFGVDVGGFYSRIPDSNIDAGGVEVRYAVFEGGALWPAVGVRGAYTKLSGVDQLAFNTKSVDASVSKGFTFLTPYLGVGQVWTSSDPQGDAETAGLNNENFRDTRLFGGVRGSIGLLSLTGEVEQLAGVTTFTAKLSVGF